MASTDVYFEEIAKRYDRNNVILSLGICNLWNRALARTIPQDSVLLDLCAGTGAITHAYLKEAKGPQKAILLDTCKSMLDIAKERAPEGHSISYLTADAQSIPLDDACVDAVTCAYGVRNIDDPIEAGREVHRILKPGGIFAILELTRPKSTLLHIMHKLYTKTALPLFGKPYRYLSSSIQGFITPEKLSNDLQALGFQEISRRSLSGGIATLLVLKTRGASDPSAEPEGLRMLHKDRDEANSRGTIGEE